MYSSFESSFRTNRDSDPGRYPVPVVIVGPAGRSAGYASRRLRRAAGRVSHRPWRPPRRPGGSVALVGPLVQSRYTFFAVNYGLRLALDLQAATHRSQSIGFGAQSDFRRLRVRALFLADSVLSERTPSKPAFVTDCADGVILPLVKGLRSDPGPSCVMDRVPVLS